MSSPETFLGCFWLIVTGFLFGIGFHFADWLLSKILK